MAIKLSICIPTFNRANLIGQTLENIAHQKSDEIEIVIVDGASTDDTEQVVHEYQKKIPNLIYFRQAKNGGVDRDLAKTVELAKGEYCWLFSSDDLLAEHALSYILKEINSGDDVYLCNRVWCTYDLKPIRKDYWLNSAWDSEFYDLGVREILIRYLRWCDSIGGLFSCISCVVVKKEKWDLVDVPPELFGICYTHVYRIFKILFYGGLKLWYLKDHLVLCRGGNDSFLSNGLAKRYLIDFDGYLRIGNELFSNDPELKKYFLEVLHRSYRWFNVIKLRASLKRQEWMEIKSRLAHLGYKKTELLLYQYSVFLKPLVWVAFKVRYYFSRLKFLIVKKHEGIL